jgi:hypothetical protein
LGKTPGRGSIGGTTAVAVCALGLLGGGALTAQAQVSVPQLPQAPSVPAPPPSLPAPPPVPVPAPPRVELPSPPPVSVPEPVQRVAPAVGDAVGGSTGGSSGDGPVSGAGDAVRGGVERVLGGSGPASAAGGAGAGAGDALGLGGSRGTAAGGSAVAAGGAGAAAGAAGGAGTGTASAGGRRGARARRANRPARARERAALKRVVERRRARLVRRFRGCLDALPRMQRATLVLRYGVGPLRARSGRETARLLDVARRRVRVLERRGLRALTRLDGGAACVDSGVSRMTLVAVYDLLTDTSATGGEGIHTSLAAGLRLANAATVALDGGEGAVAGARESGGDTENASRRAEESAPPGEDGPVSSAGPSLGDPFGIADPPLDNPLLLVLVAIVVACMVSAGREIRRALR